MRKVAIIGHFGQNLNLVNGQTIKTHNLANALSKEEQISLAKVDTCGWKKHPIRLVVAVNKALKHNDVIIMLPAQKGVRVFSSLLLLFNKRGKKKLYYDIIGAWLPSLIKENPRVAKALKKFDGLWAETQTMKTALEKQGFKNVTVIPNFKDVQPISESEIRRITDFPIRLVIFSRISELKGVTDAIETIAKVNKDEIKYTLDIYGPVEAAYQSKFDELLNEHSFVKYGGIIESSKSVSVLKDYHVLLFPTKYFTEGIPGTIIDAFSAGLPVIASEWESYSDVLTSKDSITYEFGNNEALYEKLKYCIENVDVLNSYRRECLKSAEKFSIEFAKDEILKLIFPKSEH